MVSRINMLFCHAGYHGSDVLVKLMPRITSKAVAHLKQFKYRLCWYGFLLVCVGLMSPIRFFLALELIFSAVFFAGIELIIFDSEIRNRNLANASPA